MSASEERSVCVAALFLSVCASVRVRYYRQAKSAKIFPDIFFFFKVGGGGGEERKKVLVLKKGPVCQYILCAERLIFKM